MPTLVAPTSVDGDPSGDVRLVDMGRSGASCPCDACKVIRADPTHKLKASTIHQWNFAPTNWQLRDLRNDPYKYFLGVELETDNYSVAGRNGYGDRDVRYSQVANQIAADMRRPKTFWIPKYDGSISGPEFVSHPATLTYWRSKERQVAQMFQMLVHAGFRSYDNDKCGMHVNISRTAIADRDHFYRLLTLLHVSKKWSVRMAQRTLASADSWASFRYGETADARIEVCDRIFSGFNGAATGSTGEKYLVLNAPGREPRFEFRLPRGTLRIDRFFKNLEWTVAMIEFTRDARLMDCHPDNFSAWVEKRRIQYPYLAAFLRERAVILHAAVTGTDNPPARAIV